MDAPPPVASEEAQSLLMTILNPSPMLAITIALIIFSMPLFLHFFVFRGSSVASLPIFLLLGPAGVGKTAIMTSFANTEPVETRTSQAPLSLEADIPETLSSSSKFRSASDPTLVGHKKFLLQDSPGHGKLRALALDLINTPAVRGCIFVVDANAAAFSEAAEYLYSALLAIQKLQETRDHGKSDKEFRVLVACNKSDLFTALPTTKVKKVLAEEIRKVQDAKSRGIVGVGEEDKDTEDVLGSGGDGEFDFASLEEVGINVEFKSGSVQDDGWRLKLGEWVGGSL